MATRNAFEYAKKHPITDDYELVRQLGTGKFSVVKLALHKESKVEYAVKMIDKKICDNEELVKEVTIMRMIDEQPGVIHLKDVYEDDKKFNLVLDLVRGGELFDKIVEKDFYTEKDAADLVHQIVSVVKYLHKKNIVHRDLKPENLLFVDDKAEQLKLCDFGLAEKIEDGQIMTDIVGSPTYMAPEILSGEGYSKPVDMYSIGVIMYILLCGFPPFEPEEGVIELEFPSPEWDGISESVKLLITRLLSDNPLERPTAPETLEHPWVSGADASKKALYGTIKTMSVYNTVRRNPGASMRTKEQGKKTAIFDLFNGGQSPRGGGGGLADLAMSALGGNAKQPSPSLAVQDKKKKRKSARKDDRRGSGTNALSSFGIGSDQSMRDIGKRLDELGMTPGGSSSPKTPKSGSDKALRESQARVEELEEELTGVRKELESSETLVSDKEVLLYESQEKLSKAQSEATELKDKKRDLEIENQRLQTELREQKIALDSVQKKLVEAEKFGNSENQARMDAEKKLKSEEMKIKLENIVAERLEGKKIKELEEKLRAASEKAAKFDELDALLAKSNANVEKLTEEKKVLQFKVEQLSQ